MGSLGFKGLKIFVINYRNVFIIRFRIHKYSLTYYLTVDEFAPPGSTFVVNTRRNRSRAAAISDAAEPERLREQSRLVNEDIDWDAPTPNPNSSRPVNHDIDWDPPTPHLNSSISPCRVNDPLADRIIPGGHENAYLHELDQRLSTTNKAERKTSTESVKLSSLRNRNIPDVLMDSRLSGGNSSASHDDEEQLAPRAFVRDSSVSVGGASFPAPSLLAEYRHCLGRQSYN